MEWSYDREVGWHTAPVNEQEFMLVYMTGAGDYALTAMREGDPCGGDLDYFDTLRSAKRYAEQVAKDGTYTEYLL